MKSIKLNSDTHLDPTLLVDSRMLAQANSGGGKSMLLRLIIEQAARGIQVVVLDPEGEFASLRGVVDMLLAGRDGEVPAHPKTANVLAAKLLELKASAVIDLYDLAMHERREFVRRFLSAIMAAPRSTWHPMIIVIDEAHLFCPERSSGEAESTQAVISLMSQGRKRGFCGILATQRLSKLHKDAAAECNNVCIGRTGLDVDQRRAAEVLGMSSQSRMELRDLKPGEWFGYGPAFASPGVIRFQSDKPKSEHPRAGSRHNMHPPAASAAIRALIPSLRDSLESPEGEIYDLDSANAKIKTLERQLTSKAKADPVDTKPLRDEVARLTGELRAAHKGIEAMRRKAGSFHRSIKTVLDAHELKDESRLDYDETLEYPLPAHSRAPKPPLGPIKKQETRPAPESSGEKLPPGERAVLTACCQYRDTGGCTREQLTILAGYKRSSRDAYIQRLRGRELVEEVGKKIRPLQGAEAYLGDFEPLPTGEALQQYWLGRLPPGEAAILENLIAAYPHGVTRESLSEATGYKRSSRDAYLQRLKARQIADVQGGAACAAAFLFD